MVDPEHLLLTGVAHQFPVQLARRSQVVAEGLLDHHPLPARSVILSEQTGAMHLLDHLAKLAGRDGQIEKQVLPQWFAAEGGKLFCQARVSLRGRNVALTIEYVLRELLPDLVVHRLRAGKLVQGRPQFAAPHGISLLAPGNPDDAKVRGHLLFLAEVIEGGHELPRRQIATGAENDDGARFYRLATSIQATGQQVVELCGLIHAQTIVEGQPIFKYSMWRAGIPIPG